MPIFDHTYLTIIEVVFSFPEFVSACKKYTQFINSFLMYSRISRISSPIPNRPIKFLKRLTWVYPIII